MNAGHNGNHNGRRNGRRAAHVAMSDLPQAAQDALLALRDAGEQEWQAVASVTIGLIDGGLPAMGVYEAVAGLTGRRPRTIRDYVDVSRTVGDLLGEFPFAREHWKAMIPQARRALADDQRGNPDALRQRLADIAGKWLESSDRYGGVVVPPEVLFAADKPIVDPVEQYERAVHRAATALEAAMRHGNSMPRTRDAREVALLETALVAVGDLHDYVLSDDVPGSSMGPQPGEAVQE